MPSGNSISPAGFVPGPRKWPPAWRRCWVPPQAEDRALLEADLIHFCRELLQAARGHTLLPRPDRQAKAAFDEVLDLIRRPSARAAPQAERAAAETARGTRGSAAERGQHGYVLARRQADAALHPGDRGNPRRHDLSLRHRAAETVPVSSRPVRHDRRADRRQDRPPQLHDLLQPVAAACDFDHGQARRRRPDLELAARQSPSRRRADRRRAARQVHLRRR